MAAITAPVDIRLLAGVSGRFLAFIALVGLSVPLSAELAFALPSLLPELGIREGQFGPFVNDYVLDVMANWSLLALAPMMVIDAFLGSVPELGAILWSCVGWAPIGLAYAWATRSRQLTFFVLSVYPIVWVGMKAVAGA
jgi:hypothetical protein